MINPGLDGRAVLVTGANNPSGIGAAVAVAFAQVGAKLFLHFARTPYEQTAGTQFYREQQSKSCSEVLDRIAVGATAHASEADFNDPTTMCQGAAEALRRPESDQVARAGAGSPLRDKSKPIVPCRISSECRGMNALLQPPVGVIGRQRRRLRRRTPPPNVLLSSVSPTVASPVNE